MMKIGIQEWAIEEQNEVNIGDQVEEDLKTEIEQLVNNYAPGQKKTTKIEMKNDEIAYFKTQSIVVC